MSESLSALYLSNPQLAIALRRRLEAEAQMKQGTGSEPIRSPWQGVNNLANALIGGWQAGKEDQNIQGNIDSQNAEYADTKRAMMAAMLGGQQPQQQTPQPAPTIQAPGPLGGAAPGGAYADRVMAVESGGNPNARNPNSTATGAGQFIDSTWLSLMRKNKPEFAGKSDQEILALRSDPMLSRQMVQRYADDNAQVLGSAGLPVNDATQYLAHWFGPGGAKAILSAPPGTPIGQVMPPEVLRANPNIANLTTDGVLGVVQQKMGGGQGRQQVASLPPAATDAGGGAPMPPSAPPPQAAPGAPPQVMPPQGAPGGGMQPTALQQVYMRAAMSQNPRVQALANAVKPFLQMETPNLDTVTIEGQLYNRNPRTGQIVGPSLGRAGTPTLDTVNIGGQIYNRDPRTGQPVGAPLGRSEAFTPKPADVEAQELRLHPPTPLPSGTGYRNPSTGAPMLDPSGQPVPGAPQSPVRIGNRMIEPNSGRDLGPAPPATTPTEAALRDPGARTPEQIAAAQAAASEGGQMMTKKAVEQFDTAMTAARSAARQNHQLDRALTAMDSFSPGMLADAKVWGGRVAAALGMNPGNASEGEILKSIQTSLQIGQTHGEGQVSNYERQLLAERAPIFMATPQGARKVVEMVKALNQFDIGYADVIARNAEANGGAPNPVSLQRDLLTYMQKNPMPTVATTFGEVQPNPGQPASAATPSGGFRILNVR